MADNNRETDLILKPGEYCFLLDKTKGVVSVLTGYSKLSMSATDATVVYSEEEKKFVEVPTKEAIKNSIVVPEGWYCQLKNPAKGNEHPKIGTSNITPELDIGRKIICHGPQNFSLYPGQMCRVIKGHILRSNQYLVVRIYDTAEFKNKDLITGQLLVIKGNEKPFYMPDTGYEVVPDENGEYVRQATVLEDLQYCILISENGNKKYIHGPAVVFPEANETFVVNPENGTCIFKAIELSEISGIYVKVVADYDEEIPDDDLDDEEVLDDEDGDEDEEVEEPKNVIHHSVGEELFITGETQKIYYPRIEHAIISYENKVLHHAIAIPEGEGRYVLDRLTGNVKTVYGPKMYLPDPRYEVIVKRKLTKKECDLWYPGNKEVLKYNEYVPAVEFNNSGITAYNALVSDVNAMVSPDALDNGFLGQGNVETYKNAGFSRGNTYTKPRTITIDNKYDGVVTIDVWTGYAVNVVSKNGRRRTEVGPKTVLLEYDETLEVIEDTNGDTVFLHVNNDRIYDSITVQTKDFVNINVKVSYNVNFDLSCKDNWFNIENYKEYLKDNLRSSIKKEVKKICLEDFYNDSADIISKIVLKEDAKSKKPITFANGMYVADVEVLLVEIEDERIKYLLDEHQEEIVSKTLELSAANKEMAVTTELAKIDKEKQDIRFKNEMLEIELNSKLKKERQTKEDEYNRMVEASRKSEKEADKEMELLESAISKIILASDKEKAAQRLSLQKEQDKLEADKEKMHSDNIKKIVDSITPDLVAAIQTAAKSEMLRDVATSLSPYALASKSESVVDVTNRLLRGTGLEEIITAVVDKK